MKVAQNLLIAYFRTKFALLSVWSNRKAAESAFELFCTPIRRSRARVPAIFSSAQPVPLQVGDYNISGHRWPRPGARKVLILHGFESSSRNFEAYITALTAKGFDVTVFDAPAHGNSSGKKILLPEFVNAIRAYNTYCGPFDAFVTHSFGGLAVSQFLDTAVSQTRDVKVVLIAPATELSSTIDLFLSFLKMSKDVRLEFDRIILERSGHTTEHFSVSRAIQNFTGDVLWIHDEEDQLTPLRDAMKVMELNLPNVRFHITHGLGHRRIYRDPGIVHEAVEFLGLPVAALAHRHE